MNANKFAVGLCGLAIWTSAPAYSQQTTVAPNDDPKWVLVGRLDLERYKATLRGLGQYGDRQQGTDRNRAAVDWIEAQLRSYGCAPERIKYVYNSPGLSRDQQIVAHPPGTPVGSGEIVMGLGGARIRGMTLPVVPNNNPAAQTDPILRALNEGPSTPGPREEVYCTKVGSTRPDEMYIVGAHMDGRGFGEATDDNGSGAALVMELARVLSAPDVVTERSIRFALWNNEETGFQGATAYITQRGPLQGKEDPPGSGRYPEPRWLAMIQHDMLLWDHGAPRADGTIAPEQRPEADINVEFLAGTRFAAESMGLAFPLPRCQRALRDRLSGRRRQPYDQYGFQCLHESGPLDQPARKRARHAERRRLEPALPSGHRPLHVLFRQGLPARPQRRADDAWRDRAADRGYLEEINRAIHET
jgi:hypothetical protein